MTFSTSSRRSLRSLARPARARVARQRGQLQAHRAEDHNDSRISQELQAVFNTRLKGAANAAASAVGRPPPPPPANPPPAGAPTPAARPVRPPPPAPMSTPGRADAVAQPRPQGANHRPGLGSEPKATPSQPTTEKATPAWNRACLRRGTPRHRDGHGPAGGHRSIVADRESCRPACRRPRQSRAALPPGVQVVRTVARSTWTPGDKPAPPRCGTTADGTAAGRGVVFLRSHPNRASRKPRWRGPAGRSCFSAFYTGT
jgi:hypothetical protein